MGEGSPLPTGKARKKTRNEKTHAHQEEPNRTEKGDKKGQKCFTAQTKTTPRPSQKKSLCHVARRRYIYV